MGTALAHARSRSKLAADDVAGNEFLEAVDNDPIAGFYAVEDEPAIVDRMAETY